MNWYLKVLQQYFDFKGRARRKEYWMFYLFNIIATFILIIIDSLLFDIANDGLPILTLLYSLGVAIPSLAVTIRRLHDTGRSGWWFFVSFVPFVGGIILLIFTVMDSEPGKNNWGPNPKEKELAAA